MHFSFRKPASVALAVIAAGTFASSVLPANAQQLAQKIQEIKMASAANKAALTQYTWSQQQTISIKGEVKKVQQFQVRIGPDGTQQKTEINAAPPAQPSGGRLKRRIVEKKTEEYKDYAEAMASTAKQYAQPDPAAIQAAFDKGNVSLIPNGASGAISLVIKNYLKPGDQVTLVFNAQKSLQSAQINSYMDDPSDSFTVAVQYAKLPAGSNQVSSIQVNGKTKQLGILIQNSNFQRI
jgi:hypothetical protein